MLLPTEEEEEMGFNDSQLSLDSEIMQHHAIDEERVCKMYDIIRGRHYRGRKQEGMEMEMKEETIRLHFSI